MIVKALLAISLVVVTMIVHGTGVAFVLGIALRSRVRQRVAFVPVSWLVIRIACWLVLLHSIEIAIWAAFFRLQGCFLDFESALYFSGVTYVTLGYGDLVLPEEWRLFGPIEGLTGILMCGLSTGFFFAIVAKLHELNVEKKKQRPGTRGE